MSDITLQPNKDIVTKIIASWEGYAAVLSKEDRQQFMAMMRKLYNYSSSIEVTAEPFENEPVFMSLMLEQHKIIKWLLARYSEFIEKETKRQQN